MTRRPMTQFTRHARSLLTAFILTIVRWNLAAGSVAVQMPVQTDGPISSMTLLGSTLYMSGTFTYVGPHTGNGVRLDPGNGSLLPGFPVVDGIVYAAAPDGAGGWYIGGSFSNVGGVPRANIARVLANLTVDTWNPGAFGDVRTLVVAGSTVYVGGDFTFIGGQPRNRIAAIDASTGLATTWCGGVNGTVRALTLSGGWLYAGGDFTQVSYNPPCGSFGDSRNFLAAFDLAAGVLTSWNPGADGHVHAMVSTAGAVYAGGEFLTIAGQSRAYLAALDPFSAAATTWNPGSPYWVRALTVTGGAVIAGGPGVRGIDPGAGATILWSTGVSPEGVYALVANGNTLYVGGTFETLGAQAHKFIGALDATTGSPTSWSPRLNASVFALAADGSSVLAGGRLTSAGGEIRNGLAAVNTTNWAISGWNSGSGAHALTNDGAVVFAAGTFSYSGGGTRDFVAALDPSTGLATAWNANILSSDAFKTAVRLLAVSSSTLYLIGGCCITSIGGASRTNEGAVNATTAVATPWDPDPSPYYVLSLAPSGSLVYLGGVLDSPPYDVGYLASTDATTGAASSWSPGVNGPVYALAPTTGVVFAGGEFNMIGGGSHLRLAALDPVTGVANPWSADAEGGPVYALVQRNGVLYAGGAFTSVGGEPRGHIAAVDPTTGSVMAWDPYLVSQVRSLIVGGGMVYADGNLPYEIDRSIGYVAAITAPSSPTGVPGGLPGGSTFALHAPVPSPVRAASEMAFDMPTDGRAWLNLYDTAGRRVMELLEGAECPAGRNVVHVERGSLAGGLYFARLRALGHTVTRKIFVLP